MSNLEFSAGKCKVCKSHRKIERKQVNHLLHLALTVLTGGLWVVVWLGVGVRVGGWRCSHCGSKKVKAC